MEDIKRVKLSEIVELITKGTTPTTLGYEFQDEGVNFLKIECFDENGGFIESKVAHISEECHKKMKRSQLKNGDILFSIAGAIGRVAIVTEEMLPANINQALAIIRISDEQVYLPYIKLILTSPIVIEQFERKKQGVAQLNLSLKDINEISIPLPSKDKQIELAELFDKVVGVISKRNKELSALDDLIKARFVEMFGDPRSNPFGFEKKRLKDTCKVITGNTPSRAIEEYYGDYIEWIKTDNIVSGILNPTQATESLSEKGMNVGRTVEKDSILMACIAGSIASIGRVCITDRTVAFNQQINAVVPEQYNILFLYVLFQMSKDYLVEDINMALKGILSKSKLEEKEFIIPPMDLQEQFSDFVKQVDKSKVAVQKALDETQMLFDSLMQKYFA
jgi:type I restriction enzyme, S subunit